MNFDGIESNEDLVASTFLKPGKYAAILYNPVVSFNNDNIGEGDDFSNYYARVKFSTLKNITQRTEEEDNTEEISCFTDSIFLSILNKEGLPSKFLTEVTTFCSLLDIVAPISKPLKFQEEFCERFNYEQNEKGVARKYVYCIIDSETYTNKNGEMKNKFKIKALVKEEDRAILMSLTAEVAEGIGLLETPF